MRDSSSSSSGRQERGAEKRSGRGDFFQNRNMKDLQKHGTRIEPSLRTAVGRFPVPGLYLCWTMPHAVPRVPAGPCSPATNQAAGRTNTLPAERVQTREIFRSNNNTTHEGVFLPRIELRKIDNFFGAIMGAAENFNSDLKTSSPNRSGGSVRVIESGPRL